MADNVYPVNEELSLPGEANPRFADLTMKEENGRIIGGDIGDLRFRGYQIINGRTVLNDPELLTRYDDLTEDEVIDYATAILYESYESVGIETVEHS